MFINRELKEMKSFFKRSAISLIVLGMTSSSYAAYTHNNNAMWSPNMSGWFIGVEGLDLRPMNGDLDYVSFFPTSVTSPFSVNAISTDHDWSWRFYGGIKFGDNDDITLSWMRMRDNDKDNSNIFSGATVSPRWFFTNDWDVVQGKVDFDLDAVYGVWGHTINFNNPWSVRYAAGFEYAKLDSDMTVLSEEFDSTDGLIGFTGHSHLKGFGPRVEFDMTYHLPSNFALFANANAALLVSTRKISLNAQDLNGEDGLDLFNINYSTRHVVVPKFGARLGVCYTAMFGQAGAEGVGGTALSIDAGWQVESYIHAIERPGEGFFGGLFGDTAVTQSASSFTSTKTSNFGDSGFFIGLKLSSGWM
jgi:hypothetical protein